MEEAARAIQEGKMPTSAQAVRSLDTIKQGVTEAFRESDISKTGREVLEKTSRVLEDTKRVIIEKNPENELQELIANVKALNLSMASVGFEEMETGSYESLGAETKSAIDDLVQLTKLLASSGEFRRCLRDVVDILREFVDLVQGVTVESLESIERTVDEYSTKLPPTKEPQLPENREEAEQMVKESAGKAEEATQILGEGVAKVAGDVMNAADRVSQAANAIDGQKLNDLLIRLKAAWKRLVEKEEWQETVESLVRTLDHSIQRILSTISEVKSMTAEGELAQVSDTDRHHLEIIQMNSKKLLQNLAQGYSFDRLAGSFQSLVESSKTDENLNILFSQLRNYLQNLLTQPEFVDSPEYAEHGRNLVELAKSLNTQFYGHFQQVLDESYKFILSIAHDRLLNQYAQDWSDLMAAMFLDVNGRPTLKPELFYDATQLSNLVAQKLKFVHIENIIHSDADYDYSLSNIQLSIVDIAPSFARIRFTSKLDTTRSPASQQLLEIKLAKIQTFAKDIHFDYTKKTMPKLSDHGLLTLSTGDQGLILHIDIIPALDSGPHAFHIGRVFASVPDLDFEISNANHEILYTILGPYLRQKIRSAIESEIEKQLTASLMKLDYQLKSLMDATYGADVAAGSGMAQPQQTLLHHSSTVPEWSSPAFGK